MIMTIITGVFLGVQLIDARLEASVLENRYAQLQSRFCNLEIGKRKIKGKVMRVETTAYLCVDEKERRLHGITKSGDLCEANWSAAVDPSVIPLGSLIYVPDLARWFIAHDTGNMIKGKMIDLAVDGREEAAFMGRHETEVIIFRIDV